MIKSIKDGFIKNRSSIIFLVFLRDSSLRSLRSLTQNDIHYFVTLSDRKGVERVSRKDERLYRKFKLDKARFFLFILIVYSIRAIPFLRDSSVRSLRSLTQNDKKGKRPLTQNDNNKVMFSYSK